MESEYRRGEHHVHRHIAGEHLLIGLRRSEERPLFAMSPSAAAVWDALADWTSEIRLVMQLQERYDVSQERAEADVREFLEQLRTVGALQERALVR